MLRNIKLFLFRFFNLRHGEGKKLFLFASSYFFMSMSVGFIANIIDSIAITDNRIITEIDIISLSFIISAFILILITVVYSFYSDRMDKRNVYIAVMIISGGLSFMFQILIFTFEDTQNYWIIVLALYVYRLVITVFLTLQFWEMINNYFDLREGKRLYPIILITGTAGYSIASFLIIISTNYMNVEDNLIISVACIIIASILLFKTNIYIPLIPNEKKRGIIEEVRYIFSKVKNNRFIGAFSLSTLIFGIASGLIMYTYNDIVTGLNLHSSGLAVFLGVWRGSANLIVGIIQPALIYQTLSFTNFGKNFLLTLILKIFLFIIMIIFFMLSMVATADFSRQLLQALVSPAAVIGFSILPRRVKGKIMNINNGIISQVGIIIAGTVLQFFAYRNYIVLLSIIMLLIGLRIVLNYVINREYINTLSSNIKNSDIISIFNNIQSIIAERDLFDNLIEQYRKQETPMKIFILNSINKHHNNQDYVIETFKKLLVEEEDPKIKYTIISIFNEVKDYNISNIVSDYINSDFEDLKKISAVYLLQYGSKENKTKLRNEITAKLKGNDKKKYDFAVSVVKKIDRSLAESFINIIREKLDSDNFFIKRKSIITLAVLNDDSSLKKMSELLNQEKYKNMVLKAFTIMNSKSAAKELINFYKSNNDHQKCELKLKLIKTLGKINTEKSFEFLTAEFHKHAITLDNKIELGEEYYKDHIEYVFINSITDSIINLGNGNNIAYMKKLAYEVVNIYMMRSYQYLLFIKQSESYIYDKNIMKIFNKLCNEEIEKFSYKASHIFSITNANEYKAESILDAVKMFKSTNQLIRAQAFETFENLTRTSHSKAITIILDPSISDIDKINSLKKHLKKINANIEDLIYYWLNYEGKNSYKLLTAKRISNQHRIIKDPPVNGG